MRYPICLTVALLACDSQAQAQNVTRDIRYATAHERQVLDVYAPAGAKNLPVVFWIHGGGWQAGDKRWSRSSRRPSWTRGFVFVSTNYRLLPTSTWAP